MTKERKEKVFIGSVDFLKTKRLQKYEIRKEQDTVRCSKPAFSASAWSYLMGNERKSEIENVMEVEMMADKVGTKRNSYTGCLQQPTGNIQMRLKLDNAVLVSERYGESNRAIATIASSAMHDLTFGIRYIGIKYQPRYEQK